MFEYFGIALQRLHQNVKILGVRDVVNLVKPNDDVLDINSSYKGLRAEFMPVFLYNKASIDYIGLVISPVERFQIVGVLLLGDPAHIIFIYHLTSLPVRQSAIDTILWVILVLRRLVLPIRLLKLGSLYAYCWLSTHLKSY